MIALVEGAERQKTPNEIALNILLAGLTIVFLIAVVTLQPFAIYSGAPQSLFVLVSLLVCLIPTTIGGLLSAIGIAGMDRLVQHNVLAMSGRAVEAAGDVHTLLLDKTGTITLGNRQATEFMPAAGRQRARRWPTRRSWRRCADETPEGRSIVVLAKEKYGLRGRELSPQHGDVRAVHRADAHVGRRPRRRGDDPRRAAGGCASSRRYVTPPAGGARSRPELAAHRRAHRARGRHAAGRGRGHARARRHPPEGHRQGRHARAVRAAARDGHQDRDDHRRQPADRRRDRQRGRRGRLPGRGDARGQDGADQARAGATASSWR